MFERSELEWDKKKKKRVSFFFSKPLRLANKHLLRAGRVFDTVLIIAYILYNKVSFSGFAPVIFACLLNRKFSGEEAGTLLLLHPPFQLASLRQGMGGQFVFTAVNRREGSFAHPCLGGGDRLGCCPATGVSGRPLYRRL